MNHYIDPAGVNLAEKRFANCYAGTIGRQFGEEFITGDAITASDEVRPPACIHAHGTSVLVIADLASRLQAVVTEREHRHAAGPHGSSVRAPIHVNFRAKGSRST